MNNDKAIELVEHKENKNLTNSEEFLLNIYHKIILYRKYILVFSIGFIIGVLL